MSAQEWTESLLRIGTIIWRLVEAVAALCTDTERILVALVVNLRLVQRYTGHPLGRYAKRPVSGAAAARLTHVSD
jgi:hypothetical protein